MKKSLIALSIVAGLVSVAHAENKTILSGSLGYSVGLDSKVETDKKNVVKDAAGTVKNLGKSIRDNNWDLRTATAKFGIHGQEDINSGLQAIYKFEFGVDPKAGVNETKKAFVGLKGGFGAVTFGNQGGSYGDAVKFNDTLEELSPFKKHELGKFTKGIKYETPNTLYGFKLSSTIQLDGKDPASEGVDLWDIGAIYDSNGVFAGLGYQRKGETAEVPVDPKDPNGEKKLIKAKGTSEVMGTSLGYHNENFQAGVGYIHEASRGNYYNVGGEYYTGPNTFRATVVYNDYKKETGDKDNLGVGLGYKYNFSERTYSWVEGQYTKTRGQTSDGYQVVVGIRHDF